MSLAAERQTDRWYPRKISAGTKQEAIDFLTSPNSSDLIENLKSIFPSSENIRIAEFGVWQGGTSVQFAKFLDHKGELYLFDFEDNVRSVASSLKQAGHHNIHAFGCSYKHLDSYNWSLRKLMDERPNLRFDYIYLDGAHTWAVDALAFFLCDMMLNDGGYIEFDDYSWRLLNSSLDPKKVPIIGEQYTDEQIEDYQVAAIVDLIVKRRPDYIEIMPNRIFRKSGGQKLSEPNLRYRRLPAISRRFRHKIFNLIGR